MENTKYIVSMNQKQTNFLYWEESSAYLDTKLASYRLILSVSLFSFSFPYGKMNHSIIIVAIHAIK